MGLLGKKKIDQLGKYLLTSKIVYKERLQCINMMKLTRH